MVTLRVRVLLNPDVTGMVVYVLLGQGCAVLRNGTTFIRLNVNESAITSAPVVATKPVLVSNTLPWWMTVTTTESGLVVYKLDIGDCHGWRVLTLVTLLTGVPAGKDINVFVGVPFIVEEKKN
jgi:hypothetical protein